MDRCPKGLSLTPRFSHSDQLLVKFKCLFAVDVNGFSLSIDDFSLLLTEPDQFLFVVFQHVLKVLPFPSQRREVFFLASLMRVIHEVQVSGEDRVHHRRSGVRIARPVSDVDNTRRSFREDS